MTDRRRLSLAFAAWFVLVACMTAAQPALAAWPNQPALNLKVCGAPGAQTAIVIIPDGSGGAFLAWSDTRAGANYHIYAQHVLATGVNDPAWPVDGLLACGAGGSQYLPVIAPDGVGGVIVAWEDFRGPDYDVYAQHLMLSGSVDPAWPVNGAPVCTFTGFQYSPRIVADGAGGSIIAWSDGRGANTDIYAQHVLASGAMDGSWPVNGRVLCQAANAQGNLVMIADDAGGAIMAWEDSRLPGNGVDVYATHVLASGVADPAWPVDGRAVIPFTADQVSPAIISDAAGGAIVTWMDNRTGTGDVYAQHVLSSGAVDGAWPGSGRPLCTAANNQYNPKLVSDGAGGAIVSWYDARSSGFNDIYAQHVLANGTVDPGWPVDGRALCTAANSQFFAYPASDGAGGAIVTWYDGRTPGFDIYAQHVLASGAIDPLWPTDGRALCIASGDQSNEAIASDGLGGAIVAWEDQRAGSGLQDVYAQRIARFDYLGSPEGEITGVKDVPNDNGGSVKVSWNASYLDTGSDPNLTAYDVLRSVPSTAAAMAARVRPAVPLESGLAGPGDLVTTRFAAQTLYWELLGSVSALHYVPGYSFVAATTGDSVAAGNPLTAFEIVAHNAAGTMYWPSSAAYGYSVDNLPPALPQGFTAAFRAGITDLTWNANGESDLAGYHLYRGGLPNFTPSPSNLVATPTTNHYSDVHASPSFYKLAAIDVHGNLSPYASPVSGNPLDAPLAGIPATLELAAPSPNPARASSRLSYGLPHASALDLAIFDLQGRRLRTLAAGDRAAGEYSVTWDLRDDAGHAVASGIYLVRLEAGGVVKMRRMIALH